MIAAKPKTKDSIYLVMVSVIGFYIVLIAMVQFPIYEKPFNLILLVVLAAVAEIAATFMAIDNDKIAFEVGTAIGLGACLLYTSPSPRDPE